MRKFFQISIWLISLNAVLCFLNLNGQVIKGSFKFEDMTRSYIVYLPINYQPLMPVIFNLHGYTDDAEWQMNYSKMNDVADTAGFIVVYPDAVYPGFNSDITDLSLPDVDDVGFISKLLDIILCEYDIDINRVYCCGWSNGGNMTCKLICQIGDRFAAGATVSSALPHITADSSNLSHAFPFLMCNGTLDEKVPYNGGREGMHSVPESIDFWLQNNNCNMNPDSIMLPDIDITDGCWMQKFTWANCLDNSKVILYKVINGGHCWPGGAFDCTWSGNQNNDINMNTEIWNFSKDYSNLYDYYAYGKWLNVYPKYIPLQGDTLKLLAQLCNFEDNPVEVWVIAEEESGLFKDSLELFDDGLHNDGQADDNIWGGEKYLSGLQEGFFDVNLRTHDISLNFNHYLPVPSRFTTAGPIEIAGYDVITLTGGGIGLGNFKLTNIGSMVAVENVIGILTSNESCIDTIHKNNTPFGDIGPGETKSVSAAFAFKYSGCSNRVEMQLDIISNGTLYWTEIFEVPILTDVDSEISDLPEDYSLGQNYPNPFNPSTTINYSIPQYSKVTLSILDILGNEIAVLVKEPKSPGTYEVEFDGSGLSSGVYLYRLKTDKYSSTKKMLMLK